MTDKTTLNRDETIGHAALPIGYDLDHYRLDHVLGSGGFGITYKAEHKGLGKDFAIKEYFPEALAVRERSEIRATTSGQKDFEWGLARFLDEARMLARFDHPAIVNVHHIFEAQGTAYLVMEFVDGRSLSSWMKEQDSAPAQEDLDDVVAPLLDALEAVHGAGYLHRDIAPDNIYVRENGTPVLLDFGSARAAVNTKTRSVSAIIKAGYSPIEQYTTDVEAQGAWTDIYALAATLYRVVTGEVPQESTSRQLVDRLVPAHQAAEGRYRHTFLQAIDKGLTLDPAARPQSIADWREALLHQEDVGQTSTIEPHQSYGSTSSSFEDDVTTEPVDPADDTSPVSTSNLNDPAGDYFSRHWRGQQHPHWSLWVNSIVPAIIGLILSVSVAMHLTPDAQSSTIGDCVLMTFVMLPQIFMWRWQIVGFIRSILRSKERGVSAFSRSSAGLFSLIYAGLILLPCLFYVAMLINAFKS